MTEPGRQLAPGSTVLTIGTFDLLHVGHLELLEACRALVDRTWRGRVVVAVNRDAFVERYKGRRPVASIEQRMELVAALRVVDDVRVNVGDEDSGVVIDAVRPSFLAIGDDWLDRDAPNPEARYLAQLGISRQFLRERDLWIEYIPRTRGTASSSRRAEISDAMREHYRRDDARRSE